MTAQASKKNVLQYVLILTVITYAIWAGVDIVVFSVENLLTNSTLYKNHENVYPFFAALEVVLLIFFVVLAAKILGLYFNLELGLKLYFSPMKLLQSAVRWVGIFLLYFVFSEIFLSIVSADLTTSPEEYYREADNISGALIIIFMWLAITRVFVEEFYFRGVLFGVFYSAVGPGVAVIVVSSLFAFMHVFGGAFTLFGIFWVFLDSVFLTVCRIKTKSIYIPCLIHMLMNLIG